MTDKTETKEYLKTEEGLKELTELARQGMTMEQIAKRYDITRNTLYVWTKGSPELKSAILEGKKVADERVEDSLYEQCFDRPSMEETIEYDSEGRVLKRSVRKKVIPASVTAIQYWLANRSEGKWKARQQLELTGSKDAPVIFVNDMPKDMKSESTEGSLVIFATEPEPDIDTESE